MIQTFFGLTQDNKLELHRNIFNMIHYGKGWTFTELYNMPIFLRNYYMKLLTDAMNKENERIKKSNQLNLQKPNI